MCCSNGLSAEGSKGGAFHASRRDRLYFIPSLYPLSIRLIILYAHREIARRVRGLFPGVKQGWSCFYLLAVEGRQEQLQKRSWEKFLPKSASTKQRRRSIVSRANFQALIDRSNAIGITAFSRRNRWRRRTVGRPVRQPGANETIFGERSLNIGQQMIRIGNQAIAVTDDEDRRQHNY